MSVQLRSLIDKLTPLAKRSLEAAANLALNRTHHHIDIEHLLCELLERPESDLAAVLRAYGVDQALLQQELSESLVQFKTGNTRNPVLAKSLPRWLERGWLLASAELGQAQLGSGTLLLALLTDEELGDGLNGVGHLLRGIDREDLRRQLPALLRQSKESSTEPASNSTAATAEAGAAAQRTPSSAALDRYTVDLTAQACAGKIDPVLGRDAEVRQMVDILLRRRQNNPILTGEPGVGKTAVVEGLALRIAKGEVPPALSKVVLRTLDLGLLQAGASVKGEFESRLRSVIDEVKASLHPIILFIDEAHTMIGAGGQAGQNDAANLLKPALARGELRTIAATTWSEYKKYFEKDAALARRFQVVKIEEPSEEIAALMLRAMVPVLEAHHGVRVLDEAVVDAVKLSSRYISGRQLPDKAVSVLDTACARVALSHAGVPGPIEDVTSLIGNIERALAALNKDGEAHRHAKRIAELREQRAQLDQDLATLQAAYQRQKALVEEIATLRQALVAEVLEEEGVKTKKKLAGKEPRSQLAETQSKLREEQRAHSLLYESVDGASVADIISSWTGIPLGRMVEDELATVRNLQSHLEQRVIGQSHALEQIARRVQISKANLEDPNKPKGVFLLVGPSGVGKTETALALADVLFGGQRNLVVINMSEYQEAHSVAGLKGSPPGYVGYGEGGVLTEAVRRKPYSVVLLDEVEKAHPDVLELFFQVFDKGVLEDAEGREVDFKNTIIILTSNVGTDTIMQAVEHGVTVEEQTRAPTREDLSELIRPQLQRAFKPAFLGRLTVVPYFPVQDEVLHTIIKLKLTKVQQRLKLNHGAELSYPDELVAQIAARCLDVDSGARDADAIITNNVLSAISGEMLGRMAEGCAVKQVSLQVKNGDIRVRMS
jgi:type VI secretion system protein VasG